ncbi:MAG: ribosome maturation factor RimM [Nocardioidaceae bacterium]
MQVVVGRIGRAHGIRGEVGVDVRTDEPELRFAVGASVTLEASGRSLTVRSARPHQSRLLVVFDGVADRTAAESLGGSILTAEIEPGEQPDDPAEFYDHQLVGLEVRTTDNVVVGDVAEVLHLPAQDTLAVRTHEGEVLVPFVEALVPTVDVPAGYLLVRDVPGLLDPERADPAADGG